MVGKGENAGFHHFLLFPPCFHLFNNSGHELIIFGSPEHKVLRVSYCDQSPSVGVRRPIDQSVPNLATICMPIRSRMSSIMGQIELEHLELFALEFGKIAENDFVYTLSSTNINQSGPNLVKVYMSLE